jgi:hypothetical protein
MKLIHGQQVIQRELGQLNAQLVDPRNDSVIQIT